MFAIFLICNKLAGRDFAGEGLNSLKKRFFLLNSLKQCLANDSFWRILFMQITISNFRTSTSSPRYHLAFFRALMTKLQS